MSNHTSDASPYPDVPSGLNLPSIEERVLGYWDEDKTFQASIDQRETGNQFVFYDGPPFANGLPHYGHLLTGFVKDAVPRYATMRGRRVERRFGWDCHGLPAELTAEKELGVTDGRAGIEALGIDIFNDYCATLVNRTADEWYRYVRRQARWVDTANDYKTMDRDFMESVLWAFKALYDKGLIYEGYRVLPYCWECETPLSNFETRQDDSYRSKIDPAVTVKFPISASPRQTGEWHEGPVSLMAWTTTPWTLPSNLAVTVGRDIRYVGVRQEGSEEILVLASERLESYREILGSFEVVGETTGAAFLERTFQPIFPYFADVPRAFRVLDGDFVTTDEGTGIVQMAPGFGEDDQRLCESEGIAVVCPVDGRGRFTAPVADFLGLNIFEANPLIIEVLRSKGVLVDQTDYDHSYPHCWRTDTPLIYRAVSSWFVRVTALKDRLLERNQEIEWVPAHVRDGAFGKWLEGARDWALTRNRYWGTPIPVWKSDDPNYPRVDVYGSLDEIEADFGVRPENLHRPHIDELTRPNPDDPTGKSRMVRVTDVLDCWFESGSMPYAQLHYPFDNKQRFEDNFPADFIVEYIGQTRGWFYTLHVLSVALFDKPPFQHCMAHGILLGEDGRKLSKRLANYPDPWEVFEELGADAMRWFLLSSSVLRGQEMSLSKSAMFDTVKRAINPIWNAYYFLTLYGNADRVRGEERYDSPNLLDRYILAKAGDMARAVTTSMERFDLSEATAEIERYLDALTNWYIRRSRERFWSKTGTSNGNDEDKQRAYDTLHTVLLLWTKVAAPLLPMLTEEIYQGLTGERSVHLADWPEVDQLPSDPALVAGMDLVREVCSLGHSIRKAQGLRARLPLARVIISGDRAELLAPYIALIAEELNVKDVELQSAIDDHADHVLNVIPSQVGPRLGSDTPKVMAGARAGDWSIDDGIVTVRGVTLLEGEFQLLLRPKNPDSTRVMAARDGVVSLDLEITESLAKEGLARDVVREIQAMRKDADLHITDHIVVTLHLVDDQNGTLSDALQTHHSYIAEQVLADQLLISERPTTTGTLTHGVSIGDGKLDIEIVKVQPR